jgi:hypothetical protein
LRGSNPLIPLKPTHESGGRTGIGGNMRETKPRVTNPAEADECLMMIAVAMGTTVGRFDSPEKIPDHHLAYLMNKFAGRDSLVLDLENQRLFERLKEAVL